MPAGDRTGPLGYGPRTGRGLGFCAGFHAPGFEYPGPGMGFGRGYGLGSGFGRGMGMGRGRGFWRPRFGLFGYYPYAPAAWTPYPPGREGEAAWLEGQAQALEQELLQIRKKLEEIDKAKGAKK